MIDARAAEVDAYLAAVLTRRSGAWWHAERRFALRRFADREALDMPERFQLLASVNALRPVGLAPVTGPELDAFLAQVVKR